MSEIKNAGYLLERNMLVFERILPGDIDKVWQLISTRDGLSRWFMATEEDIVDGGTFSFGGGWDGTISIQDNSIRYSTKNNGYLQLELQEKEDGCLFRMIDRMSDDYNAKESFSDDTPEVEIYQPGGTGTHWAGVVAGYHGFVNSLEATVLGIESADHDQEDLSSQYAPLLDKWFASFETE